jgi:hypothetical protein
MKRGLAYRTHRTHKSHRYARIALNTTNRRGFIAGPYAHPRACKISLKSVWP